MQTNKKSLRLEEKFSEKIKKYYQVSSLTSSPDSSPSPGMMGVSQVLMLMLMLVLVIMLLLVVMLVLILVLIIHNLVLTLPFSLILFFSQ